MNLRLHLSAEGGFKTVLQWPTQSVENWPRFGFKDEMKAVGVRQHSKKGWQIVHKCLKCGVGKVNVVGDDPVQPDDWSQIIELS